MAYINAHRGDTELYDLTLVDVAGTPVDLDAVTQIWFTVKARYADGDSGLLQKTLTGGGIAITNAAAGQARITLNPADTQGFPSRPVKYYFDIQVSDADGITTPIHGWMRVSPDVTHSV